MKRDIVFEGELELLSNVIQLSEPTRPGSEVEHGTAVNYIQKNQLQFYRNVSYWIQKSISNIRQHFKHILLRGLYAVILLITKLYPLLNTLEI
jgi:hypothetical protein